MNQRERRHLAELMDLMTPPNRLRDGNEAALRRENDILRSVLSHARTALMHISNLDRDDGLDGAEWEIDCLRDLKGSHEIQGVGPS